MTNEPAPTTRRKSLADLMQSIEAASNPELEIIERTIERARVKDPELADLIRSCAIPRRFDVRIIGVLREAEEQIDRNESLLRSLAQHNFVLPRRDGGYVYHDNIRDLLLETWRADDKRAQFDEINQRLVNFYKRQHRVAEQDEEDLWRVTKIVQRANPNRHAQLTALVETRVVVPLLEALYHATLTSPKSGYDLFRQYAQAYEAEGRLTLCFSLLNATHDYLERLPSSSGDELPSKSGKEHWLLWTRYWKARLARQLRRNEEAEGILRELVSQTEHDTQLRLWCLGELGSVLHQQYKLNEARQLYSEELDLAKKTGEDDYNLPVSYSRIANLHWLLGELDQAIAAFQEGIRSAQHENNSRMEAYEQLDLSGVFMERGDWNAARDAALQALHLVRTRANQDRALNQNVAMRFMFLLAQHDPRLIDATYAELKAMAMTTSDPFQAFQLRAQYANVLRSSGQLRRADELLAYLYEHHRSQADPAFLAEIFFQQAMLRDDQGRLDEAIDLYTAVIERSKDRPEAVWSYAAALSNRAILAVKCARWQAAESELAAAMQVWQSIGHSKLRTYIQVLKASALRGQGQLSEAQTQLDEAHESLGAANPIYTAEYHRVQGDIYRDRAGWEQARQQYEQALTLNRMTGDVKGQARNLSDLASVATDQAAWQDAVHYAVEAQKRWRELAKNASYNPSNASKKANEFSAQGMRLFSEASDDEVADEAIKKGRRVKGNDGRNDRLEDVAQASMLFRAATERIPSNIWYRLNLAYAQAELKAWKDAAEALEAVVDREPEWMGSAVLYRQIADYRLQHIETLFQAGQFEEAAQLSATYRSNLDGHIAPDQLLSFSLKLGDSLVKLERFDSASAEYQAALEQATTAGDLKMQGTFHARIAFLAGSQLRAQVTRGLEHFRISMQLWAQAGLKDRIWELVRDCFGLLGTPQQYHTLSGALRVTVADLRVDQEQRRNLRAIWFELIRSRYRSIIRPLEKTPGAESILAIPLVTPIVIEADERMFPQLGDTPEALRMINTDIPQMRNQIQETLGVTIPGVRVRPLQNVGPGVYTLRFRDTPIVSGTTFVEHAYSPDATACLAAGLFGRITPNPDRKTSGMWLRKENWERARRAGLELLDPYQYMLFHLAALIRQHLSMFIGFQDVQNRLKQWAAEEPATRQALIAKALPDTRATVRLVQVIQGLAEEQVAVHNLDLILQTFADFNPSSTEIQPIVEQVRMNLSSGLMGDEPKRVYQALPPDFEQTLARWVRQPGGKKVMAIPPDKVQELLATFRTYVAGKDSSDFAVVVRQPELRAFVRRLISTEFPTIVVLAEAELAPHTQLIDAIGGQPDVTSAGS